jgi:aminocarboxymuconate-semialdehyde decarboxylase
MSVAIEADKTHSAGHAPVIDFHVHVLDREVLAKAAPHSVLTGFGARPSRGGPVQDDMTDPARQIARMDKTGVDISVLSSATVIEPTSWADARTELDLCRRLNDTIAAHVARHPERFAGSFTVPLQDVDLALGEMRRAVEELGFRVANLPSQVQGAYLGAPRFRPFWEAAAAAGVACFIHPEGTRDPWFQDYGLWNSAGQSIEEVKVMASLIYEGVMESLPALKIVMAHGGGYFPHYMGRLDRNVTNMPHSMKNISRKPSDYLRRFHYDTCVYDPAVLTNLKRIVGVECLVLGSDAPVGDLDPLASLRRCEALSEDDIRRIARETPADLLGLAATAPAGRG